VLPELLFRCPRSAGDEAPLPAGTPVIVTPAGEGMAEAPASAPMDIPPTRGDSEIGGSTQEGQGR
jgi:hypothetical protein